MHSRTSASPITSRVHLAWAKLAGIVVLLAPVPARLKEWAYAAFALNIGFAITAHIAVGDGPDAWLWAVGTGVLWGLSYFWRRLDAAPRLSRLRSSTLIQKSKTQGDSPSKLIDARIKELDGWRGKTLARLRALIKQADPDVVEEWKWNVPAWSRDGIICTGETYKSAVKLTFAKGAAVKDPAKLFNSSLEGNTRRAIDFREGDEIDADALKALIRAAVAVNKKAK